MAPNRYDVRKIILPQVGDRFDQQKQAILMDGLGSTVDN